MKTFVKIQQKNLTIQGLQLITMKMQEIVQFLSVLLVQQ